MRSHAPAVLRANVKALTDDLNNEKQGRKEDAALLAKAQKELAGATNQQGTTKTLPNAFLV